MIAVSALTRASRLFLIDSRPLSRAVCSVFCRFSSLHVCQAGVVNQTWLTDLSCTSLGSPPLQEAWLSLLSTRFCFLQDTWGMISMGGLSSLSMSRRFLRAARFVRRAIAKYRWSWGRCRRRVEEDATGLGSGCLDNPDN